jgi:uncharacterized protein (DUF2235 family)
METKLYPVQTQEFTPHPEPPPEANAEEDQPRLPKFIRALKDSSGSTPHPRTIVICLDGTGDQFDGDNSNIVNFVSCLKKHSPGEQVTYYQSGIGTYDKGGLRNGVRASMDMAVGSGLGEFWAFILSCSTELTQDVGIHIKDAYRFLMQKYRDGDIICLIGFSRGAYTIRCLAGMLHKVGLLPASNGSQVNFAYNFYKDDSAEGWKMSADFKKTFCTDVNVYFLGLWDCVASVGFIPRKLPCTKHPTNSIHYFRHAMALDEHRSKFKVCQWEYQQPDLSLGLRRHSTIDNTHIARLKRSGIFRCFGAERQSDISPRSNAALSNDIKLNGITSSKQKMVESRFKAQEEATMHHQAVQTDVLEVWFMGAHADVGGGAVRNESRHMLSRIPLRWMIRQCFECNTGILFNTNRLAEQGLDVHTLWPLYQKPLIPTVGPPPVLMEKYEQEILAPLQRRSTVLRIDHEEDAKEDAKEDASSLEDLQYVLPSESTEDHFDSMARLNDQLVDAKGWWILELWPVKARVLAQDGEGWEKKVRLNMGRYRAVRGHEPNMHWTVRHMIGENRYTLKARVQKNARWVDSV